MKKIIGKVAVFSVVLVMLFSVLAFGAGTCVIYDPRVGELLEQVRELENRLRVVEEENRLLREQGELREHQAEARRELRGFVNEMRRYESFLRLGVAIFAHVDDGLEAIDEAISKDEVDEALESAKGAIADLVAMFEELDWAFSECGNFALHASVDNTTVSYGDYFVVSAKLVNMSGRDLELFSTHPYSSFLRPTSIVMCCCGFERMSNGYVELAHLIASDRARAINWASPCEQTGWIFFERSGIFTVELDSLRVCRETFRLFCDVLRHVLWLSIDFIWMDVDYPIGEWIQPFDRRIRMTITDYPPCYCWDCSDIELAE